MADTPTQDALRALLAEAERAEAVMLRECGMGVLDKVVLEQARAALAAKPAAPVPASSHAIAMALVRPECARLREWAAIGPVQRAALESFADAMAAAPVPAVPRWHWQDLQDGAHLPPCDQIFVGVNVNGYTCTANATDGDKCWHETPEEIIEQMSGLRWWAPYVSPMDVGASSTPAALSVQAEPVAPTLPAGWVPLRLEWEPGYPEDVAFGPQRMMDRLKKWLDKHFAQCVAEAATPQPPAPVPAVPLSPDELADKCEVWLQGPDSFMCNNPVDAYESGFRAAEAHHNITGGKEHG